MRIERLNELIKIAEDTQAADFCVQSWFLAATPDQPHVGPGGVLAKAATSPFFLTRGLDFEKNQVTYLDSALHQYDGEAELFIADVVKARGWAAVETFFDVSAPEAYAAFSANAYVGFSPERVKNEFIRRIKCLINGESIVGGFSD